MSNRVIGLLVLLWLITYCAHSRGHEDSAHINNVQHQESRVKRKVSYYHPFLKDEKLTPEMQSLLMEVLQLERLKRALHGTKKKFRQFRNNSIYQNPITLHKSKKFLNAVDVFTLPTTRLAPTDDRSVSLITKPMSFWLKPLTSKSEYIAHASLVEDSADSKYFTKDYKQSLFDLKKNVDDIGLKKEDDELIDLQEKKIEEAPEVGPEVQGSEDVLGLDGSKNEELNKVFDEVLKYKDSKEMAHTNSTYSKREIRLPLAIQSVSVKPIPMNVNREVSVLTKPSFYWLNQNKQIVNSLLVNNTMVSSSNGSETNKLVDSANNTSSSIQSGPSNLRILYYEDTSPIHTSFQSNAAAQNKPSNGKPPEQQKLGPTPLEALGLSRNTQGARNITISKEMSLTSKPTQFWLDASNTTKSTTQMDVRARKVVDVTSSDLTTPPASIGNQTNAEIVGKPVNISAQVSLLTKPSHYWTEQYMKNTTETGSNVSVTRSIGYQAVTERIKLMAVNLSNVISVTNRPSKDWIYEQQLGLTRLVNTTTEGSLSNRGAALPNSSNYAKYQPHANMRNIQNRSSIKANVSTNNTPVGSNANHRQNISLVRQSYAINELPKEYFKQRENNKTQNNSIVVDITKIPFQSISSAPNNSFDEKLPANSFQSQMTDLNMPKILPFQSSNSSLAAQANPYFMKDSPSSYIQNKSIMNEDVNLPQVYYTGALSQFNGYQNGMGQNIKQGGNLFITNEDSAAALPNEEIAAKNLTASKESYPKTSFLNGTNLLTNLETPQYIVPYNVSNKEGMEMPQIQSQYSNENLNSGFSDANLEAQSFKQNETNTNQIVGQFQNNSVASNSFLAPNEASKSVSLHEDFNQNPSFNGNIQQSQNGNLNTDLNNLGSAFVPSLQNQPVPMQLPQNNIQGFNNDVNHYQYDVDDGSNQAHLIQKSEFIQNPNNPHFKTQLPYINNPAMLNTFNDGTNISGENKKPSVNNSFSINSFGTNQLNNNMAQFHADDANQKNSAQHHSQVSTANNSEARSPFSTNLTEVQMADSLNKPHCQGPGCLEKNPEFQHVVPPANVPLASINSISNNQSCQGPGCLTNDQFIGRNPSSAANDQRFYTNKLSPLPPPENQIFRNVSQSVQDPASFVSSNQFGNQLVGNQPRCEGPGCNQMNYNQDSRSFTNISLQSLASNASAAQMLSNESVAPRCEGPGCSLNNAFSTNSINNQIPFGSYATFTNNYHEENVNVNSKPNNETKAFIGPGPYKVNIAKSVNKLITTPLKNTTEHLNQSQKRNLYYQRFGYLEPLEMDADSDEIEPYGYWKRENPLKVYSGKELFQPHKYWKRDVSDKEFDDEVENDKNFNDDKAAAEEFERYKKYKSKKSLPIEVSIDSGESADDGAMHKSIKRDFPVRGYETDDQDYLEKLDPGFDENDDDDGFLHKSIKRDFPVDDYERNEHDYEPEDSDEEVFHKTIKRDSPVIGYETDDEDNSKNVEFKSAQIDSNDKIKKRGTVLKQSLKSRSEDIESNKNGTRRSLAVNLNNPNFQKFLQEYVSEIALNTQKRYSGLGSVKLPSLVEALQNYIQSSYYTTEVSTITSPFSNLSSMDIIDMNSLLQTVDVMSTVDRYGDALEDPAPITKPSSKYKTNYNFSFVTQMPFLLQSSIHPDNIVNKNAPVTLSIDEVISKLRTVDRPYIAPDKLSKKSITVSRDMDANSAKELITPNDLLALLNSEKKNDNDDNFSVKEIFDILDQKGRKIGRSSNGVVNGLNCNFNGSWLSTVAGMRIDLNQTDNRTFRVSLASKTPPSKGGLLFTVNCTDWLLSAKLPMKKTSILQVTGVNEKEKKLAVFLGECRVCNDKSLVYGHWIVLHESRDCEDIFSTQESYTDIWRQEGLHILRMHNLQLLKMGLATTEEPSGKPLSLPTVNACVEKPEGHNTINTEPPAATAVPSGDNSTLSTGGAVVVTGGVLPDVASGGGTGGTAGAEIGSTAATNAVNIVVGKKRIAIKL